MANTPVIITAPNNKSALEKLVTAGLVVGGLWYGRKLYRDWRANRITDQAGGDPNVQAAMEIHQAIDGGGTSETVLFDIASRIKDWDAVSKAYRKLYINNMLDDIKGDLSPADFQKFLNIYNLSKTDASGKPVAGKNTVVKGSWVFVEKDVNVRKTPRVVGTIEKLKNQAANALKPLAASDNIIFLAKPGKYLGVTTGRISIDTATDQSTLFIEVTMGMVEANGKHSLVTVWVASSQVKTEKQDPKFKPASGKLYFFSALQYNRALSGFDSGIGESTNFRSELILSVPFAAILDVEENLTGQAMGQGLILGYKDSEYANRAGERFFVFKNIQGLRRMVSVNQVTEKRNAA